MREHDATLFCIDVLHRIGLVQSTFFGPNAQTDTSVCVPQTTEYGFTFWCTFAESEPMPFMDESHLHCASKNFNLQLYHISVLGYTCKYNTYSCKSFIRPCFIAMLKCRLLRVVGVLRFKQLVNLPTGRLPDTVPRPGVPGSLRYSILRVLAIRNTTGKSSPVF